MDCFQYISSERRHFVTGNLGNIYWKGLTLTEESHSRIVYFVLVARFSDGSRHDFLVPQKLLELTMVFVLMLRVMIGFLYIKNKTYKVKKKTLQDRCDKHLVPIYEIPFFKGICSAVQIIHCLVALV